MIKLKITIPTYNRPEFIRRQVRDLLPQLRDGVSLIVYDNCSEVPVASLFTEEELSQFSLKRNDFNIGGGGNICRCFTENAEDSWIWLLGDDDRIVDDAVDIILDTINQHQDCCYLNFQQKKTKETECFEDFLEYMKILGAFGISFFQSACIFNMNKLKPYVMHYYDFIASWVGHVAMVIKYLEDYRDAHCYFTDKKIIQHANAGGWSHLELVVCSSILIDKFHYNRKIMKSTLFKAIGDMNFTSLAQTDAPIWKKWYYSRYLKRKLGTWNVLRYNKITYGQFLLSVILPPNTFFKVRAKIAKKYNETVKKDY